MVEQHRFISTPSLFGTRRLADYSTGNNRCDDTKVMRYHCSHSRAREYHSMRLPVNSWVWWISWQGMYDLLCYANVFYIPVTVQLCNRRPRVHHLRQISKLAGWGKCVSHSHMDKSFFILVGMLFILCIFYY